MSGGRGVLDSPLQGIRCYPTPPPPVAGAPLGWGVLGVLRATPPSCFDLLGMSETPSENSPLASSRCCPTVVSAGMGRIARDGSEQRRVQPSSAPEVCRLGKRIKSR